MSQIQVLHGEVPHEKLGNNRRCLNIRSLSRRWRRHHLGRGLYTRINDACASEEMGELECGNGDAPLARGVDVDEEHEDHILGVRVWILISTKAGQKN